MTLSDADFDTIEAKMWNVQEADEEEFTGGQLIKIKGVVQEYNGRLQLIVNRIVRPMPGMMWCWMITSRRHR